MIDERLQSVDVIPFRTFKEKLAITRKYERLAKMEILDDKYILLIWRDQGGEKANE